MSYRTILAHCCDPRTVADVTRVADALASQFKAHLVGLSVVPPVSIVAGDMVGGVPVLIDSQCTLYRQDVPALKNAFDGATKGKAYAAQWRDLDAGSFSVLDMVLRAGRTADLIVASASDPDWPAGQWLNIADALVIESGRPVLILPRKALPARIGRKVLVAWNGRREAVRAVFDALPFLIDADSVTVVAVNTPWETVSPWSAEDDICTTLKRHGVPCEATESVKARHGAGEAIAEKAAAVGADLLVMGCYGHSRMREFVLGGATRHILGGSPLPVLMSH